MGHVVTGLLLLDLMLLGFKEIMFYFIFVTLSWSGCARNIQTLLCRSSVSSIVCWWGCHTQLELNCNLALGMGQGERIWSLTCALLRWWSFRLELENQSKTRRGAKHHHIGHTCKGPNSFSFLTHQAWASALRWWHSLSWKCQNLTILILLKDCLFHHVLMGLQHTALSSIARLQVWWAKGNESDPLTCA